MHNYATNGEPQTESPEFMGTKNLYQTSLRFYSNKLLCSLFGQRALLCLLSISFSKPVLGIRVYRVPLALQRPLRPVYSVYTSQCGLPPSSLLSYTPQPRTKWPNVFSQLLSRTVLHLHDRSFVPLNQGLHH